jgi:toxin YoeB
LKLAWLEQGWEDYLSWQNDKRMMKRINNLIRDTLRSPFEGIAKPEPLKGELAGWWSRRIDDEHRLVYRVTGTGDGQQLEIAQCRYHY